MNFSYIAVIGIYDENTTERTALKEIGINAKDEYEAHKLALLKCKVNENQTVLQIKKTSTKELKFDLQKGFNP